MKSLTRTIIVLVVFNLAMGNLVLAQAESKAEGQAEPANRRVAPTPTPPKPTPTETEPPSVEPPESMPSKPAPGAPTPAAPPIPMRTFTISGRTGLGGVRMQGLPGNVVSDSRGYYSATVEHGWTGTVMPVKEGYAFKPAYKTYSKVTTNRSNDNYTPTLITYTISGEVGVGGVLMRGLPGNPVVTGRNGTYQATVNYGWSGTVKPTKEGYAFEPPNLSYTKVIHDQTNQNYSPKRIGPAPMLGRIGGRKVLVIPDTEVKPEDLSDITQDLLVMSHILDERFKESRTIKGVFTDFGDFFGRDNRSTEAIYMQGYGVVFLMEVNFAFSPPLKPEEQKDEETAEQVDPTWQRARQQLFSPQAPRPGMPGFSGQGPGLVKFDQLKGELIETLKHAANIRNLSPDEWIIVTVIGQGRQPGEFYKDYYRIVAPRSITSRDRRSSGGEAEAGAYGGGMVGGMGGMAGGMGGMGGYGGGMGGYGGGMGGYGGGMGGFGGGMMGGMGGMAGYGEMMGGMAGYGEMGLPSATVLTIRAKKSDVSDFARGELDFEEFQEMVEIFNY